MPTLGQQLKTLRIKKGLTQEQLAKELNTTKAAISRYEKGQRQPRLEQIAEIATILGASPDELYYLFLGSSEVEDNRGEYATRMNAMAKWVEAIAGTDGIQKTVSSDDGTTKLTISIAPGGMQLKDLISLLDYLVLNDLAGNGISELADFLDAASKTKRENDE